MIFNRINANISIEPKLYFKSVLGKFNFRKKGEVRERLILFFLMQFKYATQKQLSILIDDKHRNISKILRKLEEKQYIKTDKYFGIKIIEITHRGLEEIAQKYTELFESKEKYKTQLGFFEHQLYLRSFAIHYYSDRQLVINNNVYMKILYNLLKENYGKEVANRMFKDFHRADLTIIKDDISIGVEFENSIKKKDKVKEKLVSMEKNVEIFHQAYFFVAKKNYILENFTRKAFEVAKGSSELIALLTITNLYSIKNNEKSNLIPQIVKDLEVKPLLRELKNILNFENYI